MTITDTRDMVLVHRVCRREFRLLPLMVRGVVDGDTTSASRVFRHATEMIDALQHHHQNEDELLWPRLEQRAPLDAVMAEQMQAQHNVIGELLARAGAALPAWQRAARAGDGELDELAERGFAAMPKRRALVFLGHILESASPGEQSQFLRRRVPPPVRLLYRLIGRRAFTRETAALRAALAAPSRTA